MNAAGISAGLSRDDKPANGRSDTTAAARRRRLRTWLLLALAAGAALVGCTAESTRLAIEGQRRSDEIEQAVVQRQHDALCALLFRDAVTRLSDPGAALSSAQQAALNDLWNERDLVEFWMVQHERARALRRASVDASLFGRQAAFDLLIKSIETRVNRAQGAMAGAAGTAAAQRGVESAADAPAAEAPFAPARRADGRREPN